MAPGLVAVGAPTLRAIRATTPTPPTPRLAIAHRSRTTVMAGEPRMLDSQSRHAMPLVRARLPHSIRRQRVPPDALRKRPDLPRWVCVLSGEPSLAALPLHRHRVPPGAVCTTTSGCRPHGGLAGHPGYSAVGGARVLVVRGRWTARRPSKSGDATEDGDRYRGSHRRYATVDLGPRRPAVSNRTETC